MRPIYSTLKQKDRNFNTKVYIPSKKPLHKKEIVNESYKFKKHIKYVNFKRTSSFDKFLYMAELELANTLVSNNIEIGRISDNSIISKSSLLKPRIRFKEDELLESDVCKSVR